MLTESFAFYCPSLSPLSAGNVIVPEGSSPLLPRSTDVYSYWHNSQFSSLEPAAKKYLYAPPTSVASEQLFSSAGQLYAHRRSSLHGDNAEKQLLFTVRLCEAYTHGIAVDVCLDVCLSVKRVYCDKTKAPSKKSSITTNRKSPTSFPMSLR